MNTWTEIKNMINDWLYHLGAIIAIPFCILIYLLLRILNGFKKDI